MRRSACSWSTRRTASRSGGTTSGPSTSGSRTRRAGSARRRSWPPRRRPRPRWRGTSWCASACATRCTWPRGSTGRTCRSRSSRARTRRWSTGASPRRWRRRRRGPRSSTRARARSPTGCPSAWGASSGVEVLAYHAGLPRDARAEAQRRFMDGSAPVVVATNAFGMGVDKADVRTVCHESVPSSIEAYYQEAGRAGRDGAPARCLLFATGRDKGLHVFFIERSAVDEGQLKAVARKIVRSAEGDPARYSLHINELARGDGRRGGRARDRRLHGARGRHPAGAVGARSRRRPRRRRVGPGVARGLQRGGRRGHAPCAGASTGRSGPGSRARAAGARASCATSATARRPRATGPCCDVCDPDLVPAAPAAPRQRALAPAGDLDGAILEVVASAEPGVGRTRCVEILRGGRSKVIEKYSYDGLPELRRVQRPARRGRPARGGRAAHRRPPALHRRALPEARGRVTHASASSPPGAGSNLQAILDRVHGREAEVVAVGSDKPGAQALARAAARRRADRHVPGRGLRRAARRATWRWRPG